MLISKQVIWDGKVIGEARTTAEAIDVAKKAGAPVKARDAVETMRFITEGRDCFHIKCERR